MLVRATAHHLQVAGPGSALNDVGARPHVVNNGSLKPRDHNVSSFLVHLCPSITTALVNDCMPATAYVQIDSTVKHKTRKRSSDELLCTH